MERLGTKVVSMCEKRLFFHSYCNGRRGQEEGELLSCLLIRRMMMIPLSLSLLASLLASLLLPCCFLLPNYHKLGRQKMLAQTWSFSLALSNLGVERNDPEGERRGRICVFLLSMKFKKIDFGEGRETRKFSISIEFHMVLNAPLSLSLSLSLFEMNGLWWENEM